MDVLTMPEILGVSDAFWELGDEFLFLNKAGMMPL